MKAQNVFRGVRPAVVGLVAAAIAACGGQQTSLSIQGTLPGAFRSAHRAAGPVAIPVKNRDGSQVGVVTLTDARVALKEIKIKLKDSGSLSSEQQSNNEKILLAGPYVVNLLTQEISPPLPALSLAAGEYSQVELKLDKIEGDEKDEAGAALIASTDPLFGHSLYMKGTYTGTTAAGAVTDAPFELTNDFDETLELFDSNSQSFVVADGAVNSILIAFRLASWFDFSNAALNDGNLNFSDVEVSGGEVILADNGGSSVNANIGDLVRKMIKLTMDCGRDEDGSGQLESNEDDDPDSEDLYDN